MNRNQNRPIGKPAPTAKAIPWRRVLCGGLASLGLVAALACATTADTGDTSQSTGPTLPPAASPTVPATNPPPTSGAVSATDAPDAGFLTTRASVVVSTRVAPLGETRGVPTPTVRFAPTPTRVLLPTPTPFVLGTRSLFATSTPFPQVRATLVRPTATRFPIPSPTPFTGGSSSYAAGSVPTPTPGASVSGAAMTSQIQNFTLESFTVSVGTTVTWTNLDSVSHTSTSGISPNFDGAFKSPTLSQNSTFSNTFNSPGAFPYFCSIHPSMTAVITVQ